VVVDPPLFEGAAANHVMVVMVLLLLLTVQCSGEMAQSFAVPGQLSRLPDLPGYVVLQPIMWGLKWLLMVLFEGAAANHVGVEMAADGIV